MSAMPDQAVEAGRIRLTTSQRRTVRQARIGGSVTLADIMARKTITMREAWQHVVAIQAAGALVRSGGEPGTAVRWSTNPHHPAPGHGAGAACPGA